jgi:hypothetical protein
MCLLLGRNEGWEGMPEGSTGLQRDGKDENEETDEEIE